ncbi:7-deoxyloganetin glucosyltransferase [Prunus yedoensis var. nudiflora]|uniref:7-deoxyloganetin glucosyltransferase n=1 Tax=Prunus yedoensis var. nudiflora TaxID=2094558 RepID=A0A314UKX8_PRUYE|nr:7-deoxyloganetin glucosyltransferase [Prunus yedoensis var. nudiflora]
MKNARLRDIPSFIRVTDVNDIMFDFMGSETRNCLKSSAIIFNTYDEFEHEVLEHLPETETKLVESLSSNLWKEDTECFKWLDQKKPSSVVYVNYGSITTMTDQHLKEFAWGLANSKHPFLWIVRPDVVEGDSAILPDEFFEEIKDRGYIASWCLQDQVLAHPSVGAFLTHTGWNSTLESVSEGVPVLCWPFFSEQQRIVDTHALTGRLEWR